MTNIFFYERKIFSLIERIGITSVFIPGMASISSAKATKLKSHSAINIHDYINIALLISHAPCIRTKNTDTGN